MMDKLDGGPAFPIVADYEGIRRYGRGPDTEVGASGMSLRDWFAGMAMQGDWASRASHDGQFNSHYAALVLEERAKIFYRMADAMLKARE